MEPEEGKWDEQALDWYENLLSRCEQYGLVPMVTLHHFTLPQWLAVKGGFSNPDSVSFFTRYVAKVSQKLAARVPLWCIFNEPMVLLLGSYIGKFMPPGIYAPSLFSAASNHILKAHTLAYEILHQPIERSGPWAKQPIQVGIAHNMFDFLPDRWWHPIEQTLSIFIRSFYNKSWFDALTGRRQHFGVQPLLPTPPQLKEVRGKRWIDFIGVNYYTKAYVRWRPRDSSTETLSQLPLGVAFARRNEEQSDIGWAFHPEGFGKVLKEAGAYGLPLYITENGLDDKNDRLRGRYLVTHLEEVAKAIAAGTDILGYYHWSLLDNFEWIKGYGPRFGLYHVDYQTFKRSPRDSAQLYRRIIGAHQGNRPPHKEILSNFKS